MMMNRLKSLIFILQLPTILAYMSWILGFHVSHRCISNSNKSLKIRKIGSCKQKDHLFMKNYFPRGELGPNIHKTPLDHEEVKDNRQKNLER